MELIFHGAWLIMRTDGLESPTPPGFKELSMDVKGAYTASQVYELSKNPNAVAASEGGAKSVSFKDRLVSLLQPGARQDKNLAGIRSFLLNNPAIKASGLKIDPKWLEERDVQKAAINASNVHFRAKLRGLEDLVNTRLGPDLTAAERNKGIDAATAQLREFPGSDDDALATAAHHAIEAFRLER